MDQPKKTVQYIDIEAIDVNPFQTRKYFDETTQLNLAVSIREVGLIQPLTVRPHPEVEGRFQLATGERRFRACRVLGWTTVPVFIEDLTDLEMLERNLAENVNRDSINPISEGEGYEIMKEKFGLTAKAIGSKIGFSDSYVRNRMRLARMPLFLKACVMSETLSKWHALAIMSLGEEYKKYKVADLCMDWSHSVEKTRQIVKNINHGAPYISWTAQVPVHLLYEHPNSSIYDNDDDDFVAVLISGLIVYGAHNVTRAKKNGLKTISAKVLYKTEWLRKKVSLAPVYPYSKKIESTEALAPKPTLKQRKKIRRLNEMLKTYAQENDIPLDTWSISSVIV